MSTDNPVLEPADRSAKFYKTDVVEEPVAPTETAEVLDSPDPEEKQDTPGELPEELEANNDEETTQYLDIDGEEHSLDDVKKWRDGHLMQSDYTKKTQALSEERKAFEAEQASERENLLKTKTEVSGMRDLLAVLVSEDEEINWAELKEDDPDKYIELKERADKRREALEKIKIERETPADDPALIAEERGKLFKANPQWFDDKGNTTETYSKEINLMNEYAAKAGFNPEEFAQMTRAHYLTTILKAAKYDQLQEKGRQIKDTREKVPVISKPKANKSTEKPVARHEKFYGTGKN